MTKAKWLVVAMLNEVQALKWRRTGEVGGLASDWCIALKNRWFSDTNDFPHFGTDEPDADLVWED